VPGRVKVTIDGVEVEADAGELVIKVAQDHGVYIPRFCWHERMKPVGMCRMCLVEVEGVRGFPPACTTPVAEGMVCNTQSDTVKKIQDGVEVQLDAAYKAVLEIAKGYTPEDVENFKDAQQKWLVFRDAACKAEYGLWGKGSGGSNAHAMCIIRINRERIADLKVFREK